MTPDDLAKGALEHSHQKALFAWSNMAVQYGFEWAAHDYCYDYKVRDGLEHVFGKSYQISQLRWLHAIHNQGHGDKVHGGKAKAEGVKTGVSDVFLPVVCDGYAGLYIELKRPGKSIIKGSDQEQFLDYANTQGYVAREAQGWIAARLLICQYLWPLVKGTTYAKAFPQF